MTDRRTENLFAVSETTGERTLILAVCLNKGRARIIKDMGGDHFPSETRWSGLKKFSRIIESLCSSIRTQHARDVTVTGYRGSGPGPPAKRPLVENGSRLAISMAPEDSRACERRLPFQQS